MGKCNLFVNLNTSCFVHAAFQGVMHAHNVFKRSGGRSTQSKHTVQSNQSIYRYIVSLQMFNSVIILG